MTEIERIIEEQKYKIDYAKHSEVVRNNWRREHNKKLDDLAKAIEQYVIKVLEEREKIYQECIKDKEKVFLKVCRKARIEELENIKKPFLPEYWTMFNKRIAELKKGVTNATSNK